PSGPAISDLLQDLNSRYAELQASLKEDPGKLGFRKPAQAVYDDATKLSSLALTALAALPQTAPPDSASELAGNGQTAPSSSLTLQGKASTLSAYSGVKAVDQAAEKCGQASMDM